MKEILKVDLPNFKAKYDVEWFETDDFSNVENIKQVYGIIFNDEGKVLVVNTVGNWQVPGGKPEPGESIVETLIRESLEEADVELKDITPLGYQYVRQITENGLSKNIGQIRFAAMVKELKKQTVDPATGKLPERRFIDVEEFLEYCPWGNIGKHIVKLGKKRFFNQ